jgi:hypothetical protein
MRCILQVSLRALSLAALVSAASSPAAFAKIFTVRASVHSISNTTFPVASRGLLTTTTVSPGQLLVIDVDKLDAWSIGASNFNSNANGTGNPFGTNQGTFVFNNFKARFGSLVGSLDNGLTFFPVGTKLEMTILQPGTLRLYCWDSDFANNVDFLQVHVEVYGGP